MSGLLNYWSLASSAPASSPPPPIRELRDLTRAHRTLVEHWATEANRVQQRLKIATSTLGNIGADVLGSPVSSC